jgi:glycosyltransferase involved in cell wall biosynthesis
MTTLWNDRERAKQMGLKAVQRFESMFTSEKMVQGYADLYQDVMRRR